ncbi:MAG TPA: MFS transporter [Planctomycetota bacterium]|jgi:hypothetical protein
MSEVPDKAQKPESVAGWLGLNRAMVAVLIAIAGLGLSEEVWRSFLGVQLYKKGDLDGLLYMAIYALLVNFLEGFGYIIGGTVAHKMGPRVALAVSAGSMALGFAGMLAYPHPWMLVAGSLLMTNWEPLSVPATFEIVGAEVPKNRRTIAFAVASIQKRLPKAIGPLIGGFAFVAAGYRLNLGLGFFFLIVSVICQWSLLGRMKPKADPAPVPLRQVLREMPPELRRLLSAEIILRWGEWFIRDFAVIYVVFHLYQSADAADKAGALASLSSWVALLMYIPMGKIIDASSSPKPYIGLTFFLFAAFPFCLVLLPKVPGLPLTAALVIAFIVNGLREMGEPARKAMIASGFPPEIRARAIGLYWGLRSFAFFPAPIVAYVLWRNFGPDTTFLIGGSIGMLGTLWYWLRVGLVFNAETPSAQSAQRKN